VNGISPELRALCSPAAKRCAQAAPVIPPGSDVAYALQRLFRGFPASAAAVLAHRQPDDQAA
jgi:hypothetical protein